jgi:alkylated DNA repair protein alkB homolog 6
MTEDELPELDKYRIASLPYGLSYITQFITAEEERSLLDKVSLLNVRVVDIQIPDKRWTELAHRRLQSHPSPLAKNQALIQAPLVEWLQKPCVEKMIQFGVWANAPHKAANHCLINQFYPQVMELTTGIDLVKESWLHSVCQC